MDAIYELKDKLCDELEEYGDKKLDAGSLEVIDKLAHTIKNLDKIIETYEEDGYSSMMYDGSYDDGMNGQSMRGGSYARGGRGSYEGGRSYARGGSYARNGRGRGSNARRDSMGRYSSAEGTEMMVRELRELMNDAPDERTKMEFKKFIQKVEQM